jgi:hypothetical protein
LSNFDVLVFGWLLAMIWARTGILRIAIAELPDNPPNDEEN